MKNQISIPLDDEMINSINKKILDENNNLRKELESIRMRRNIIKMKGKKKVKFKIRKKEKKYIAQKKVVYRNPDRLKTGIIGNPEKNDIHSIIEREIKNKMNIPKLNIKLKPNGNRNLNKIIEKKPENINKKPIENFSAENEFIYNELGNYTVKYKDYELKEEVQPFRKPKKINLIIKKEEKKLEKKDILREFKLGNKKIIIKPKPEKENEPVRIGYMGGIQFPNFIQQNTEEPKKKVKGIEIPEV